MVLVYTVAKRHNLLLTKLIGWPENVVGERTTGTPRAPCALESPLSLVAYDSGQFLGGMT
jgi:hypothetical protein